MKQLEPTIENQSIAGTVDPVGIELLNAFALHFLPSLSRCCDSLVRKLAIALGVIDQPGHANPHPAHRVPWRLGRFPGHHGGRLLRRLR